MPDRTQSAVHLDAGETPDGLNEMVRKTANFGPPRTAHQAATPGSIMELGFMQGFEGTGGILIITGGKPPFGGYGSRVTAYGLALVNSVLTLRQTVRAGHGSRVGGCYP